MSILRRVSRMNVQLTIIRKYDIIPLLLDVAQGAVKEKVIRVIVATFRVRYIVPYVSVPLITSAEPCYQSSYCEPPSHVGSPGPSICQESMR